MTARLTIHAAECDLTGAAVEEMRSAAAGEVEERQGKIRLTYAEDLSADEPDAALTRVTILASPEKVIMRRDGEFSAVMVFEPGQTRTGTYRTPFGEIPFELETAQAAVEGSALSGGIRLVYVLRMQGSGETRRRMHIRWEAESPC